MYMATIVIVAVFEKPEMASVRSRPIEGASAPSVKITPIAVTSFGRSSETKRNRATPMRANTINASGGGSSIEDRLVRTV